MLNLFKAMLVVGLIIAAILIVRAKAEEPNNAERVYTPENSVLYFNNRLQNKLQWLDMSKYNDTERKVILDTNVQLSHLQAMLQKKGFVLKKNRSRHFPNQ